MKLISVLLAAIILYSCSGNKKSNRLLVPPEYQLSLEEIRKGKTLVFTDTKGYKFMLDIWTTTKDGKEVLIERQYDESETTDSSIFDTDFHLLENYIRLDNGSLENSLKVIQFSNEWIDDGSKYGKEQYTSSFDRGSAKSRFKGTKTYLKDTILKWDGSDVNCFVMRVVSTVQHQSDDSSSNRTYPSISTVYYGKGLGEILRVQETDGIEFTWQLTEVRPLVKK